MGNRIELEGVLYKIRFKSKFFNVNAEGITKKAVEIIFNSIMEMVKNGGFDNESLLESLDSFKDRLGLGGFSKGTEVEFFCEAYIEKIPCNTPFICSERLPNIETQPKTDDWLRMGKYRVCSYCGSIHPDDLVEAIGELGVNIIEYTSKGYKWYIKIPGVYNAGLGPIKYYRWHDTPEFLEFIKSVFEIKQDDENSNELLKGLCSKFKAKGTLSIKKD